MKLELKDHSKSVADGFEFLDEAQCAEVYVIEEGNHQFFTVFNGSVDPESYRTGRQEACERAVRQSLTMLALLGSRSKSYFIRLEQQINKSMNCFYSEDGKIKHRNLHFYTKDHQELAQEGISDEVIELAEQYIRIAYDVVQDFTVRMLGNRELPIGTVSVWKGSVNELLELIDALYSCQYAKGTEGMTKELLFQQFFRFFGKELPVDFESRLNKLHLRNNPFHFLLKLLNAYKGNVDKLH